MVARRARVLAVLMAVVLVAAACEPIRYVYDEQGRLKGVIDPDGDTAVYTYDEAGNIVGIDRYSSDEVSIVGFAPRRGQAGDEIAIQGTGFGNEDDEVIENTVVIGGVQAEVTSETGFELKVIVPEGVTTGPITVTAPTGAATSDEDFTIETDLAPVITGFTPSVVGVGDEVTIVGSNFFGDVAFGLDTVSMNGGYATLVSATATELVVTVPQTAGSGPITVSTPQGTATSTDDLFIAPSGYAAVDVGSTGRTPIGVSHSVPLDSEGEIGLLVFDGAAGQRVSVQATDDEFLGCEPEISILAPGGARLGRATCVLQGIDLLEPITLPADGTYALLVDPGPTITGSATFTVHDVEDVTGPIVPDGDPVEVTIDTPGQNAALAVDGEAGERLSLVVTGDTFSGCSPEIRIVAPDDTELGGLTCLAGASQFIEPVELPLDGESRVVVDPAFSTTGSVTLQLFDVPADVQGSISPGGNPVEAELTAPGQNAELTFSGSAGDRVFLNITDDSFFSCSPVVRILAPDDTELGQDPCVNGPSNFIDTLDLPESGEYRVLVDPTNDTTGSATFQLLNVPDDLSDALVVDGAPLDITIGSPGQNAVVTFDAAAGDDLALDLSGDTFVGCSPQIRVFAPDETQVRAQTCVQNFGSLPLDDLPQSGTYEISVDPTGDTAGEVTLTLSTTPVATPAQGEQTGGATGDDRSSIDSDRPVTEGSGDESSSAWPVEEPESMDLATVEPVSESAAGSEVWRPDDEDRETVWESEHAGSGWEDLPPLVPDGGTTAVSGRVLKLNGRPLAGVTVSVEGHDAETDETGRFLLVISGVRSGKYELVIDGSSASTDRAQYGTFVMAVEVKEGYPTFIDHTVWMPKLDTENVVQLEYPLESDVVVTTPHIPGLELHIPAGTEIRDRDGELVKEVGITPIPVDRPPYPLPEGVEVPVYFTIQPGGATIEPYGTYLVYPNYRDDPAGSWVSFYEYTPELGWHVYGKGEVTADGSQVVPDPSVALTGFTGAMINTPGYLPPEEGPSGDGSEDGDPVDLGTGLFVYEKTDLIVSDILPIPLTRTYRPNDEAVRAFGVGTTWAFDLYLWSAQQYQEVDLILPDGQRVHYDRVSEGTGIIDAVFEDTGSTTAFNNSRIEWNGQNGWDLILKDGTTFVFGENAPLQSIRDRYGNEITLQRESLNSWGAQTGNIVSITSPHGRWLGFSYDDEGRVIEARDHMGRAYTYAYDTQSRLTSVTDPEGGVTSYTYDSEHRMLTVTDPREITFLTNEYDTEGRVIEQTLADDSTYSFDYTTDSEDDITRTEVTDPRGFVRRVDFDGDGFKVSDTRALGEPEEQTVGFERDSDTHMVTAVTDPLGRRTAYSYDDSWNLTSVTALEGTSDAVATSFTYEPDFHQIASVTDPLNRVTTYTYDSAGNVDTITDPADGVTSFEHDGTGRVTSVTDAKDETTSFEYEQVTRVTVTDARGFEATRFMDAGGRPVHAVDPLGDRSVVRYDDLNRTVSLATPDGAETTYAYDANGNVTSITDPEGATTTYAYDDMDRVVTRTDPVGETDEYVYNDAGQVTEQTDRRDEVATYTYDPLGRIAAAAFGVTETGNESSVTYDYDDVSRLTEVTDTAYGSIQFAYDDLSRLVTETTPDGQISYSYNDAGERTSMTPAGGPETTYGYDDAGRLVNVSRDGLTFTATRDDLGRVTNATLPNTVTADYEYDEVGNLTNITYDSAADPEETLGGVTYGYDPMGRRVTSSGDLAGVEVPDEVGSSTYDSANRLTERDGVTYTYDAAGNLTSDGTNTYAWNARGQLSSVGGAVSAGFTYDSLGRRASKNINGVITDYRYDGANVIQTDRVGLVSDYVTGLSVDEVLARVTTDGTTTYLSDGLGSTVGLVDDTGTVVTNYTYGPFGETAVEGDPDPNPFGYTGRELDETGLYFYRARYLQPELGRFISEDPIGFASGQSNQYSYVANDPMNAADPSGLCAVDTVADSYFLANDVQQLISGGRKDLAENLLFTALDAIGFALPCATGLGAGARVVLRADDWLATSRVAPRVARAPCAANSFVPGTAILMADGTTKPIEDVKLGDLVMAADPERGEEGPREVTRLITGHGDKILVDLEVDGHRVTSTGGHPIWVNNDGEWVEAKDLRPGDYLLDENGATQLVEDVEISRATRQTVHNLSVDDLHSFFVVAGDEAILTHNNNCPVTVLGRFWGGVEHFVGKEGYRVLGLPTKGPGGWNWTRNKWFIDEALDSGQEIRLVTNPNMPLYAGGNVYQRELRYLERRGYTWVARDNYWVVVPRGGP